MQLKYSGIVKDAVQRTQQGSVFLEILAPEGRVLVAGEDHIETTFFVVAPVNQVKEQPRILLVEGTVANLVNNQTRGRTRPLRQESVFPERLAAVNRSRSSDALIK